MAPQPHLVINDKQDLKMTQFLRNQIFIARESGPVSRIELRHLPAGSKLGHEVLVLEVPEDPEDDWFLNVIDEVDAATLNDAGAVGGVQTYILLVFRKGTPKAQARFAFRRAGLEDSDDQGFDSEPATSPGLLKQLMRHNEALTKVNAANSGVMLRVQAKMIEHFGNENFKMLEARMEQVEMIEELQTMKHARELESAKALNHEERMTGLLDTVKLLAPTVINKMTGKELLPTEAAPVVAFLESLDEEQQGKIAELLSPAQQVALAEMVRAGEK